MNYRTTLGGALSALGTTLMGVGIVPQLAGQPSSMLMWITVVGFILNALGQFFGHLFSADAKALQQVSNLVDLNTRAIVSGDTSIIRKADIPRQNPNSPLTPASPPPNV